MWKMDGRFYVGNQLDVWMVELLWYTYVIVYISKYFLGSYYEVRHLPDSLL